jgi:hypothetical protein
MTHYTFRLIRSNPEIVVDVCKWEDDKRPEVYRVYPGTSSCSCVSTKRDCKHVKMVLSMIDPEFIREMYKWGWSKGSGFFEMTDIPVEEFIDAVFA